MSSDAKAFSPHPKVSGKTYDADILSAEDAWIDNLDHEAFKEDVRELGKQLAAQQGPDDVVRTHTHTMLCESMPLGDHMGTARFI